MLYLHVINSDTHNLFGQKILWAKVLRMVKNPSMLWSHPCYCYVMWMITQWNKQTHPMMLSVIFIGCILFSIVNWIIRQFCTHQFCINCKFLIVSLICGLTWCWHTFICIYTRQIEHIPLTPTLHSLNSLWNSRMTSQYLV